MQKPKHQILIKWLSWTLGGFLALGAFFDAIANANSLITVPVALAGTVIIIVSLISAQIYLSKNPLRWVVNGTPVKISNLNLGLLLPFVGMLVLLWVPVVFNGGVESEGLAGDNLKISSVRTVETSPTQIRGPSAQGIISAYWEVLLSNVGSENLSVVSYKVLQVGEDFPATWYTSMDQGLYVFENGEFSRFDPPIDIFSGSSKKIYVRLGLTMTPEASKLVEEEFSTNSSSDVTVGTILGFLYAQGTDFYGNEITSQVVNGAGEVMLKPPSQDKLREQVFVVNFTTSRGEKVNEPLSWYQFGGPYDLRRYQ